MVPIDFVFRPYKDKKKLLHQGRLFGRRSITYYEKTTHYKGSVIIFTFEGVLRSGANKSGYG